MKNIAWIVSHPIQYYSPLYNKISKSNEFDLTVYYLSDIKKKVCRNTRCAFFFSLTIKIGSFF